MEQRKNAKILKILIITILSINGVIIAYIGMIID